MAYSSQTDAGPHAPLAGVRVLDLGAYIAAPYGCTLLADQGAQVIKIEPPEGDNLRNYPSTLPGNEGRAFLGINRGKVGMVLDLKSRPGREVLTRLLEKADVLVHNFRPGVSERLAIDYPALAALHPRLVYCALTGYGDTGPASRKAGFDQVLQAMSGICALQGEPGQPQLVYGSVVDYYAASLLAGGVAAALYRRERSGVGGYVGISLLRSALAMQSARFVWADGEPRERFRDMRSGGVTGLHPTRSGQLYISATTPRFWAALCELVGLPQLAADPRYQTVKSRAELAHELLPQLHQALASRPAEEWEQLFGERVPCAAVREIEDMFDHPQAAANGLVGSFPHPELGSYRGLAGAYQHGHGPATPAPARPSPGRGQHTDDILMGCGYGASQIAQLRHDRVVA